MLIWAFVRVPADSQEGLLKKGAELGGGKLSWAWLSALNSALGLYATLGVNIPDFTVGSFLVLFFLCYSHADCEVKRYAKNERA